MLSFRNKLVKTDPEVIRQIAASTGFFDRQDVQINVEIAENLLNQKDSEHKFLFADYMDKTVAYVCYGEVPDAKEGTYEIYWLSTLNEYRGLGILNSSVIRDFPSISIMFLNNFTNNSFNVSSAVIQIYSYSWQY